MIVHSVAPCGWGFDKSTSFVAAVASDHGFGKHAIFGQRSSCVASDMGTGFGASEPSKGLVLPAAIARAASCDKIRLVVAAAV